MKIKDKVILPTSYFGPVQYYRLACNFDAEIEMEENYQKRTIRNRTSILSANGLQRLSVPLEKGKTNLPIKEVKIAYHHDWQIQHWRSLMSAYNSAPYFEYYSEQIGNILMAKYKYLVDLNATTMAFICKYFEMDVPPQTSSYEKVFPDNVLDTRSQEMVWSTDDICYNQVFERKFGFVDELSILDMIFNLGPAGPVMVKA